MNRCEFCNSPLEDEEHKLCHYCGFTNRDFADDKALKSKVLRQHEDTLDFKESCYNLEKSLKNGSIELQINEYAWNPFKSKIENQPSLKSYKIRDIFNHYSGGISFESAFLSDMLHKGVKIIEPELICIQEKSQQRFSLKIRIPESISNNWVLEMKIDENCQTTIKLKDGEDESVFEISEPLDLRSIIETRKNKIQL